MTPADIVHGIQATAATAAQSDAAAKAAADKAAADDATAKAAVQAGIDDIKANGFIVDGTNSTVYDVAPDGTLSIRKGRGIADPQPAPPADPQPPAPAPAS